MKTADKNAALINAVALLRVVSACADGVRRGESTGGFRQLKRDLDVLGQRADAVLKFVDAKATGGVK